MTLSVASRPTSLATATERISDRRLIRASELVALTGKHRSTITRWRQRGVITGVRIGGVWLYDAVAAPQQIVRYLGGVPANRDFISSDALAGQLGVAKSTIRRWRRDGLLIGHRGRHDRRAWYFSAREVDALRRRLVRPEELL